eukprot:jgi/Botrbrau1/3831/Bobra.0183s0057.1
MTVTNMSIFQATNQWINVQTLVTFDLNRKSLVASNLRIDTISTTQAKDAPKQALVPPLDTISTTQPRMLPSKH